MSNGVEQTIRDFIRDNYLFGDDSSSLKAGDSLRDAGLIDSTGILELVEFLESHFDIKVEDAEIVPENLDTIAAIVAYVGSKEVAKKETSAPSTH